MKTLRTFTSHDVRRLHVCCVCNEIGIHQPTYSSLNVPVVVCIHSTETQRRTVSAQQTSFAHPSCYIEKTSLANLLALHSDELDSIRICDVTKSQMKTLLAECRRRRNGRTGR